MSFFKNPPELWGSRGRDPSRYIVPPLVGLSLLSIVWVLPHYSAKISLVVLAAWVGVLWVCICYANAHFDWIALAWMALYPFCYYFFTFPREHPIFTVDRAFIGLVAITILVASRQHEGPLLPRDIRLSGFLWGAYLLTCLLSLWGQPLLEVTGQLHRIAEGLLFPAILGLYVARYFPACKNISKIHASLCVLSIGLALVAGGELITGKDLLPWPGDVPEWVDTKSVKIMRVDGPFETSSALCVVGAIAFFMISYLRQVMPAPLSFFARTLHNLGVLAAIAVALMPMNRGLVLALLVPWSIDYFSKQAVVSRKVWICIFAALICAVIVGKVLYPEVYEDRVSSGDNFAQRIAQNLQTVQIVKNNPLLGVGFSRYYDAVSGTAQYNVRWHGIDSMNVPHNSMLTVLSEEGSIGFLAYVLAQFYFVRAMWRIRATNRAGWLTFLYCVLVYTLFGLDAATAYYSDLNLFYMLALGLLFQIQSRMAAQDRALEANRTNRFLDPATLWGHCN